MTYSIQQVRILDGDNAVTWTCPTTHPEDLEQTGVEAYRYHNCEAAQGLSGQGVLITLVLRSDNLACGCWAQGID